MANKVAKTDSLTKGDLNRIADLLDNQFDKRFKPFVEEEISGVEGRLTDKIGNLEASLKSYIHEGVETIMEGMDNLSKELSEKEKVERMAKVLKEIGEKVGIKVDV